MARTSPPAPVLADPVSGELKTILRALKLGKLLDTLPDRLALARTQQLPHADFLELVLADEVTRRDTNSAALRARAAGLDPGMRLDTWDPGAAVRFDTPLWNELCTHPVRRRRPRRPRPWTSRGRQDTPGHRTRAHRRAPTPQRAHGPRRQAVQAPQGRPARPHPRRRDCAACTTSKLLIIDDFCLHALDATETADFYEIVVERHRKTSTVITSNRDAGEWLAHMADPLLAQSAVDRLTSTAHELVIEGESYRQRQRPGRHAQ